MSPADRFARLAALKPARGAAQKPAALRAPDETDALSRLLGAGIARNHYGEHLAIRNWFSTPEFSEPSPVALDLLTKAPAPQNHPGRKQRASENGRNKDRARDESVSRRTRAAVQNPEKWLFLDTETTGLAGGTGTYAFLVGLAWWDAGGLQVEQLFLRDFSEEHSLLQELSARLAERPVLVTFNGKSFDWPLLENRFTMTRAIRVPSLAAHLDLLHPARALWKLRLGSVRLVELERHVLDAAKLGWHREDDVSSALIPQYYFDYLRGGSAKPLAGVVKHNQMDLRGLAALFGKINSLLDERETSHQAADSLDLFGLSRYLNRRGEGERAHAMCAQALGAGLPAEFRPQATRELAIMARRRGNVERAAALWLELAHNPQDGVTACEHLAIHYERNAHDLKRAAEFAQLALAKLQRQYTNPRDPCATARAARAENKLLCRLERLRHRIERSGGHSHAPLLAHSATAGAGSRSGRSLVPSRHTLEFGGIIRMETSATKRQTIAEDTMAATEQSYFLHELQLRREHLLAASRTNIADQSLNNLLASVDAALSRVQTGTFGVCETCHDPIEEDRLRCNPLLRFCLDHLSVEEQRALELDLALAARIQRALLPRSDWSSAGWQARYHYQPAGLVSGDYCDLIESGEAFLFLLGDVAGKGVAASMLMSHLHATFRSLAGQHLPLQRLVELANQLFCDSTTAGQYATLVVGRAWPDGRVEYVSAGHLPLLHVSSTGVSAREATGVPLGMFCSTIFKVCELTLAPNDTLFLYTDGLTEIFNPAGDEYGMRRVEALAKRHAASRPEELLAACLAEMDSFSGGVKQKDDLTLLALHRVD